MQPTSRSPPRSTSWLITAGMFVQDNLGSVCTIVANLAYTLLLYSELTSDDKTRSGLLTLLSLVMLSFTFAMSLRSIAAGNANSSSSPATFVFTPDGSIVYVGGEEWGPVLVPSLMPTTARGSTPASPPLTMRDITAEEVKNDDYEYYEEDEVGDYGDAEYVDAEYEEDQDVGIYGSVVDTESEQVKTGSYDQYFVQPPKEALTNLPRSQQSFHVMTTVTEMEDMKTLSSQEPPPKVSFAPKENAEEDEDQFTDEQCLAVALTAPSEWSAEVAEGHTVAVQVRDKVEKPTTEIDIMAAGYQSVLRPCSAFAYSVLLSQLESLGHWAKSQFNRSRSSNVSDKATPAKKPQFLFVEPEVSGGSFQRVLAFMVILLTPLIFFTEGRQLIIEIAGGGALMTVTGVHWLQSTSLLTGYILGILTCFGVAALSKVYAKYATK